MKIKNLLCALLLTVCFVGCSDNDDPTPPDNMPKRTVLSYMVASNLGGNLTANIDSMIAVATPKNLNGGNLIVFYSKNKNEAELFQIKQGENGKITRHNIPIDYQGQSGIDPNTLNQVINDVIKRFPAESYGLTFSSHGTSWMPVAYKNMLRSFGEENGEWMEINELAEALPTHVKFDFILFDACSMGAIECAYELKDKTDYIIASPSEIVSYGFPYDQILPYMFANTADVTKIADSFYTYYQNHPESGARAGNIGIIKTSELDGLAQITKEIIASARLEGIYSLPLSEIQILSFLPGSPTELYDIENMIEHLASQEQYTRFQNALQKVVIAKHTTDQIICSPKYYPKYYPVKRFSGLSIYPLQEKLTELNKWYEQLEWYKAVYH